jgi:glycosyltransferase involved in cell wall biosynthesis
LIASGLISVIVPVYNNAAFISQSIDSILAQTYKHYEIIIVDDGSTDALPAALDPYRTRIRYVYQHNQGAAAARNTGLKLAQGEFVTFPDADDFLCSPHVFERQMAILHDRPAVDVVHCGWAISDEQGNMTRHVTPWQFAPELDLRTWLWQTPILLPAMLIRRQTLDRVGCFDVGLRQAEDMDLVLRLALSGCRFEWLRAVTYIYRQHSTSTSHACAREQIETTLAFWRRVTNSEKIHRLKPKQRKALFYYKLLWAARSCIENGFTGDCERYLRESLQYAPHPRPKVLIDWADHLFQPRLMTDPNLLQQTIGALKRAMFVTGADDIWPGAAPDPDTILRWWLLVWGWHYEQYYQRSEATELPQSLKTIISAYTPDEIRQLAQISLQLMPDLLFGTARTPEQFVVGLWQNLGLLDQGTAQCLSGMLIVLLRALYSFRFKTAIRAARYLIRNPPPVADLFHVGYLQAVYLRRRLNRETHAN